MRPARALIGLLLLGGCAGQLRPGNPEFSASPGPFGNVRVSVASMRALKFDTVVHQQYDFSCGSAALATLLRYHYGLPRSESDVFIGMWREGDRSRIRQVGFSLLDMKRYLAEQQLHADGYRVSLDAIAKRGLPGIALITIKGYRHFVVVKGIGLLGDPSLGLRTVSRGTFQRMWNGIYFVLTSDTAIGQRHFNGVQQWSALPRAPLGAPFLEPLSEQALALALPFYRDF
jgi:predicted double-glycine peptidase